MTEERKTVIPHQDYVSIDIGDDEVSICQEDSSGHFGERSITICGLNNLDLLIAALQDARRLIGGGA